MKKNQKTVLTLILMFATLFVLLICFSVSVSAKTWETWGDYEYEVIDSKAIIKKYNGNDREVTIPSQIKGYPVIAIGGGSFEIIYNPPIIGGHGDSQQPKTPSACFSGCTTVKKVIIPDTVVFIEPCAFWGCSSLDEITIPDSVTFIGEDAFVGTAYYNNSGNWIDGGLYIGHSIIDVDTDVSGLFTVKEGTLTIAADAFKDCLDITEIVFPNCVTNIAPNSFWGCHSLVSVSFPSEMMIPLSWSLSEGALATDKDSFYKELCERDMKIIGNSPSNLETLFINCPVGLESWYSSKQNSFLPECFKILYSGGVLITDYSIPEGIETIEQDIFKNHIAVTSVTVPDSVTTIESNAFSGCSSMTEVYLGSGLNAIRDGAFKDCTTLQKVYYKGTENDWLRKVFVGDNNEYMRNAEFIFNYDGPTLMHIPAKAPTFEEEGNIEYWIDLNTGLCYSDDKGKNQIDKDSVIIPKLVDTTVVFKDIKANKWYTESVNFAYNTGLMNGMTETTFEPNSPMSRAMLVTVLWRAEGSPAPAGATPFTDLKSKWYKNAVAWAYENGIVNGMTATTFGPDVSISREQIATIIYRYAEFRGDEVSARASITSFPDASKVSKWAKDAFSWAVAEGIISGTKSGNTTILDPKGNATRAQVATILMRYLEK